MRLFVFCAFFWLGFLATAYGEYRVFQLEITDTASGKVRKLASTLDPIQYPDYYPVKKTETLIYTDTWRCPGNTSHFLPLCPKPPENPVEKTNLTP